MQIGLGSAYETEYHLLLASDLGLLAKTAYQDLERRTIEVKRMLASLPVKVRSDRQRLAKLELRLWEEQTAVSGELTPAG